MGHKAKARAQVPLDLLAHEILNPLTSLRGCALTLQEQREHLSPHVIASLTEIVVKQSERLEWIVRAATIRPASVDDSLRYEPARTVQSASHVAPVDVWLCDERTELDGNESRVRLALEAIFLALADGGSPTTARMIDDRTLTISSVTNDVDHFERRWKLDLAKELLEDEGVDVRFTQQPQGTTVTVQFTAKAESRIA